MHTSCSKLIMLIAIGTGIIFAGVQAADAANHKSRGPSDVLATSRSTMASPGLVMPTMDSARGRKLFAEKGCVLCHSINDVGGDDARNLDASTMALPMGPFEFAARMWRGAEPMIVLQREELGSQIELTGQELADIIAFVHDEAEQKKFSEKDIPHRIKDVLMKTHALGGMHDRDEGDDRHGLKKR